MANDHRNHAIDYIEFFASDLEDIKVFYSKAFGWKFTDYGPRYVSFEDGNISGGFTKSEIIKTDGPLIILYADDLEETQKIIQDYGGRLTKAIYNFPGGRRFHFTDPSGNELAVWGE